MYGAPVGDTTLIGRRPELERLTHALHGGAGLFVVVGEAGVGKTRLVDEFAGRAASTHRVARGRADEYEPVAFGLWLAPLHQLGLARPGSDASIPAGELRWDVVDALTDALHASAPVLVVLDDLHWADDESLWVLDQVLDRRLDTRVTVLATTRPASEARSARWHSVNRRSEQVALDGLPVGDVAELVTQFGAPPVDVVGLWRRTGGNPLFIRELVLNPAGRAATTAVDLLAATLERAGGDVAELITLLAIAGPGTPLDVLAEGSGVTVDGLAALVERSQRADLIRDGTTLQIRHDLLAEAAVARSGPARRRHLHHRLADAWASRPGTDAMAARARHQALAVPTVDPAEAGSSTLLAASELIADRRAADAASLVRLTRSVLEPRTDVEPALKARLALVEADARWSLDDLDAAREAAGTAAAHAAATGDPVLTARAETAAATHHPIIPEPDRAQRLAAADAALPPSHDDIDPALRIRLLGRRAVVTMSFPEQLDEAYALADEAVARARALGDAELVAQALTDRHFVVSTPQAFAARDRAADELLDLSRTNRSPVIARWGHEWRYAACLGRGDLPGALAAAAELDAQAAIMPSPYWRWSAALRRCGLLALVGDYDGVLALIGAARDEAAGVVPRAELVGTESGVRFAAAVLYGRSDHGAEEVGAAACEVAAPVPHLFFQSYVALIEIVLGDTGSARRRLAAWQGRFDTGLRAIGGLGTLGVLAHSLVLLDWAQPAAELRRLLAPFAGRLAGDNNVLIDLSVDHHLAALALLDGDLDAARAHAPAALEFARRLGAPPLEARALALIGDIAERSGEAAAAGAARAEAAALAGPLGMNLPGLSAADRPQPAAVAGQRHGSLRHEGGRWWIDSPYGAGNVADGLGMDQLVRLLVAPGTERTAIELAGAGHRGELAVHRDLGPALDARAKREYRQRIADLQADIDEAEDHHDIERAARGRVELDMLLDELRAAVGLGGRDRPQGSGNERARINVTRSLRRAIAAIGNAVPELGGHLDVSVRTGHHCAYSPEPAARVTWHVER